MAKRPKKVTSKKGKKKLGLRAQLRAERAEHSATMEVLQKVCDEKLKLNDEVVSSKANELNLQVALATSERILNLRTGALEAMIGQKDAAERRVATLEAALGDKKEQAKAHIAQADRLGGELEKIENLASVMTVAFSIGISPFDMMEMLAKVSERMGLTLEIDNRCRRVITEAYRTQADLQVTSLKEGVFKPRSRSFDIFELMSQLGREKSES